MLSFDPADPFPLLDLDEITYHEAQEHSRLVDLWLGLNTEATEARLPAQPEHQQLWQGLPLKAMLTPYTEIRELLSRFDSSKALTVIDLGAGYGRMGFVIARHFPKWKFIGYEFVGERVLEAQSALTKFAPDAPVAILQADLSDPKFAPQVGDIYFLYDYGTRNAIEKTLRDLQNISLKKSMTVIGRGRASRDAIERQHPWLSQVIAPEHFAHYSIYKSS